MYWWVYDWLTAHHSGLLATNSFRLLLRKKPSKNNFIKLNISAKMSTFMRSFYLHFSAHLHCWHVRLESSGQYLLIAHYFSHTIQLISWCYTVTMATCQLTVRYFADELLACVVQLYVGGSETTSSTLLWMTLYLANNPDVQEKLYSEIQSVVGEFDIIKGITPSCELSQQWIGKGESNDR